MKTSSFYLYSGLGRISIARTMPGQVEVGIKAYRALAPGMWLFDAPYRNDPAAYRSRYFGEVLAPLDPKKVWNDLHTLADGHEPVLLCHEHYPTLKGKDRCHRRLVAEWFRQTLGADVPELMTEPKQKTPAAQLDLLRMLFSA